MGLLYPDETYKIVGSCMEVHKELGCGFLEAVYQEALEILLNERNIPFEREKELTINFRNTTLKKSYIADFICYEKILIELKAVSELDKSHESQVINYLNATGFKLGLLINFGSGSLQFKRIVLERARS